MIGTFTLGLSSDVSAERGGGWVAKVKRVIPGTRPFKLRGVERKLKAANDRLEVATATIELEAAETALIAESRTAVAAIEPQIRAAARELQLNRDLGRRVTADMALPLATLQVQSEGHQADIKRATGRLHDPAFIRRVAAARQVQASETATIRELELKRPALR